jgi:hypothetical protein
MKHTKLPTASGWIEPYEAVPSLVIAYDGVAYGWVAGKPTGAYALPYRGARPPKTPPSKLKALADSRGAKVGQLVLRGRWRVKVTAEPDSQGGGLHLEARRVCGPVMIDIFADAPGAAGPYRWGWSVERFRPGVRGTAKQAIRRDSGELAEGATWPDVVQVALRQALAVEAQVCAADAVTRRGAPLAVAQGLEGAETPEARRGAPIKAEPAPIGQAKTRRPAVRKGTQRALFGGAT